MKLFKKHYERPENQGGKPWFAWYPVTLRDGRTAWLETVFRSYENKWHYRYGVGISFRVFGKVANYTPIGEK